MRIKGHVWLITCEWRLFSQSAKQSATFWRALFLVLDPLLRVLEVLHVEGGEVLLERRAAV